MDATILIYDNSELIMKYAKDLTEVHMDGTFKRKPQKPACAQLFTLMALMFGAVSLKFGGNSSKTQDTEQSI